RRRCWSRMRAGPDWTWPSGRRSTSWTHCRTPRAPGCSPTARRWTMRPRTTPPAARTSARSPPSGPPTRIACAARASATSAPRAGIRADGTQVDDAPENHAPGCEDIRTLAPVGAVDKDRLRGEIDGLEARGYTPIGNALRAAADDLSADAAERSIVLVSDGIDTCAPPPACRGAEALAA